MTEILTGDALVGRCASIAYHVHKGQTRRDGVTPYITHPRTVADRLTSPAEKAVAWLHDVIEDTGLHGYELLNKGVPSGIVGGVIDITKYRGVSIIQLTLQG